MFTHKSMHHNNKDNRRLNETTIYFFSPFLFWFQENPYYNLTRKIPYGIITKQDFN